MPFRRAAFMFFSSSMLMGSSTIPALWSARELRHYLPLPSVWSGRRLLSWNCRDVAPFPASLWLTARWDGRIPFTEPTLSHEAEPEKGGTNKKKKRKSFLMRKGRKQLGSELLSRIGFPIRSCLSGAKLTKHFSRRVQASEAAEEPQQDMGVRDSLKIQNSELQSDAVTEVAVRRSRVTRRYRKERRLSAFIRAWKTPRRCDFKKPGRTEASSPAWKKFLKVKQLWRSEVEGEKTGTPSRSRPSYDFIVCVCIFSPLLSLKSAFACCLESLAALSGIIHFKALSSVEKLKCCL